MARDIVGTQGTIRKPLRAFKDLPKRNRDFIKAYVRCGNVEEAYAEVGYTPNKGAAYKLHKTLSPYIADELQKYVKGVELGVVGLSLVKKLAETSKNDMVRLQAAKELLSRALPEDPKEIHHKHERPELTDEQLLSRIEQLRNKLVGQSNIVPLRVNKGE